ncbi:MAG: COX15/CtaA family protein [Acidimicrobiales bacterium]
MADDQLRARSEHVSTGRGGITPERYQHVLLFATALLAGIVLTGAAVRLTGSGLGCEDWPTCSEDRLVPAIGFHPWIEFGNRLLTGVVSFGVGAAVLFAYRRTPRRRDLILWAWGLVAGVVGQIVLGGATVLVDLHPLFVSGHYLLSIVLLWNAIVLLDRNRSEPGPARPLVDAGTVTISRIAVWWSVVVLMVGTLVTGTGPHSGDPEVDRLSFDLGSIVRLHSLAAWVCVALVITLVLRLQSSGPPEISKLASLSLGALIAQGAVGYLQYFTGVPAALVELHVLGSVVVFSALLWTHLSLFTHTTDTIDLTDLDASRQSAVR